MERGSRRGRLAGSAGGSRARRRSPGSPRAAGCPSTRTRPVGHAERVEHVPERAPPACGRVTGRRADEAAPARAAQCPRPSAAARHSLREPPQLVRGRAQHAVVAREATGHERRPKRRRLRRAQRGERPHGAAPCQAGEHRRGLRRASSRRSTPRPSIPTTNDPARGLRRVELDRHGPGRAARARGAARAARRSRPPARGSGAPPRAAARGPGRARSRGRSPTSTATAPLTTAPESASARSASTGSAWRYASRFDQ